MNVNISVKAIYQAAVVLVGKGELLLKVLLTTMQRMG